ncbi:helix-hairpin-helix domain-containing protein [Cyanobium sp. FGCU-52]|nr:helix-hairpin-helix domain-containing protein [Cyanobium sp. FGCU52]
MAPADLLTIPGIGRRFVADFARIDVFAIRNLADMDPVLFYALLCRANDALDHRSCRNYLDVLRIAVYDANRGRG